MVELATSTKNVFDKYIYMFYLNKIKFIFDRNLNINIESFILIYYKMSSKNKKIIDFFEEK